MSSRVGDSGGCVKFPQKFPQPIVSMGVIYLIQNKVNGKSYVGQTRRKKVEMRWSQHKKKPGIMKSAFDKHGVENFEFSIICEIPNEELDDREILEIRERNTIVPNGYNIEEGGNKNKVIHSETRKKLSEARKKRVTTEETRAKTSQALGKSVKQLSLDGNLIAVFKSMKQAAKILEIGSKGISACCKGRRKTTGGFKWEYA